MKTKHGFLGLTVGLLLAGALLVAVILGGASLLTYILSISLYRIAGAVLIILTAVSFVWGKFRIPAKVATYMLIAGVILVMLPFFSDSFGTPLAMVFP